jgi:hypothetical protein
LFSSIQAKIGDGRHGGDDMSDIDPRFIDVVGNYQ